MKTWLITGASSGLGAAIADEVLKGGDRVAVCARDMDKARCFAQPFGEAALPVRMDVVDSRSIADGVARVLEWSDGIDVLVNNAGHGFHGAVEEVSDDEARALFDLNVFGQLDVTRAVLPGMRERRSGHVINIGSVAGLAGNAGTGLYSATKFALEGISESMHAELLPLGINVTIVEPGPFRTEFNGRSLHRAAATIPDYAKTAGERAAALRAGDGKQPGDPAKAARLIVDIAGSDAPPLHLCIGRAGVVRAREKLRRLAGEIDAWEERSVATAFDDGI